MAIRIIEVSESEYAALMMSREFMKVSEGAKETPETRDLMQRLEDLENRKKELQDFIVFMENHDNHDLFIHSYSSKKKLQNESVDDKHEASARGIEFKSQMTSVGMEHLANYLLDISLKDIKTTKEMLEVHKRVSSHTGGVINLNLGGN